MTAWALLGVTVGAGLGVWLRVRRYAPVEQSALPWWTVVLSAGSLGVLVPALWYRQETFAIFGVGMAFLVGGLVCFWTDLDVHRLPDWATWPMFLSLVALAGFEALSTGSWDRFLEAVVTAAGCGLVFFVAAVLTSLGLGDVKLLLSIGFVLGFWGWPAVGIGLLLACGVALVWAVVLLLRGRAKTDHLPLGPALVLGTVLAILMRVA